MGVGIRDGPVLRADMPGVVKDRAVRVEVVHEGRHVVHELVKDLHAVGATHRGVGGVEASRLHPGAAVAA